MQHLGWEWMELGYKLKNILNIQIRFSRKSARLSPGGIDISRWSMVDKLI